MFTLIQATQLGHPMISPILSHFMYPFVYFFPPKHLLLVKSTWHGPAVVQGCYFSVEINWPACRTPLANWRTWRLSASTFWAPSHHPEKNQEIDYINRSTITINLFSFWVFTWTRGRDQLSLVGLFFLHDHDSKTHQIPWLITVRHSILYICYILCRYYSMYIYMYIYIHTYIHTYIYVYRYTYTYIYIYTYIHIRICIYLYVLI